VFILIVVVVELTLIMFMLSLLRRQRSKHKAGFALPTILIASVVMLIVLLTAVSAASGVRAALDDQYYNRLAMLAAEAGQERADSCLAASGYTATWTVNSRLRPDTTCTGATISGGDRYVTQYGNVRTTFVIWEPVINSNGTAKITVVGMTELQRSSTGTTYTTYSQTLVRTSGILGNFSTDSSSGVEETCGVVNQNTWCWGNGANGRLGDGLATTSLVPVKVLREPGMLQGRVDTSVAVGSAAACVIATGKAFCWGSNASGKLGNNSLTDSNIPVAVDTTTGMNVQLKQIVTGVDHACALSVGGDVFCWGNNSVGQLGNGTVSPYSLVPMRVQGLGTHVGLPVTNIASAIFAKTTCAIATTSSGPRAYCWGYNDSGQIGDGSTTTRSIPTRVDASGVLLNKDVTDISISGRVADGTLGHACAVASGAVYCWGDGTLGVLGNNSASPSAVPVAVYAAGALSGKTALEVSVAVGHACATARDAASVVRAYCWGTNGNGQLGTNQSPGTLPSSNVPVAVYVGPGGLQGVTINALKGGGNRGCVVADMTTYCWGYNYIGQLGDGTTTDRYLPTVASYLQQTLPVVTY
jgi:alpha-tubulin suppressor-like RCC1 family protein